MCFTDAGGGGGSSSKKRNAVHAFNVATLRNRQPHFSICQEQNQPI